MLGGHGSGRGATRLARGAAGRTSADDIYSGAIPGIETAVDSTTTVYGASVGVGPRLDLGDGLEITPVVTIGVARTESFHEDGSAQEFSVRNQVATLLSELGGPTGTTLLGGETDWAVELGYRYFVEGDLLGVNDIVQVGGALESSHADGLPLGDSLRMSAGLLLSQEGKGFYASLGVTF